MTARRFFTVKYSTYSQFFIILLIRTAILFLFFPEPLNHGQTSFTREVIAKVTNEIAAIVQ